jgi:hypothetical protein
MLLKALVFNALPLYKRTKEGNLCMFTNEDMGSSNIEI